MATEVNQNFFAWSQEETSVQDISQGTSQVFGHGSISFGRFDLESLEWEKWSVFTNDRRHEEFGKFNGLVAKKKAYFEEYFKRIRELKALQQQNQQTELHLEYSGDGSNSSQTGEYEPAADHGAPTESGTPVDDSMEQTTTATTFENEMESYDYHENESLVNETPVSTHSSPVGGLQQIGKQMRGDVSGKDANSSQDNPGMAHEIMISPKRITEKDSRIGQASKIIPKTIKMTSSNVSDHTIVTKGLGSGKPSVINQMAKPESIHSLRRPREATSNLIGTTARSGITGLRRPSSAASQRPSTRDQRPVTRDASRKPTEVITPCRPSTSERRPATRESALKHAGNATPRRPSTADRRPMTKESAPKQCNIATPRRPSTANKRPVTKESTPKLSNTATPHRPSTAGRRPITKESAPKHFSVASPHRPSTGARHTSNRDMATKHVGISTSCQPSAVKQHPITREGAQKHADIVILCRPSTAERRPIVRDIASKHATVAPPCRPSTAERRPIARDVALKHGSPYRPSTAEKRTVVRDTEPKHAPPHRPSTPERRPVNRETTLKQTNVATSRWPLTPDRCLTKKGDISTPQRPSTGERRPIANRSTMKPNPKTPIESRAMASYSKGAMAKEGTPEKAMTSSIVKSRKLENISYAKERVEFQVDWTQKSPFNLPTRKMLTSNVRDDRGLENSRKSNKEGLREGVRAQAYKSNNMTPSPTGSVKTRAPAPPPPPPPPRRPSCFERKLNASNLPAVGRKPKASTPHWH
ncbi:hypothetical protein SEVIR_3G243000v4 [Setaria viridis]|uniref:TPX2 C-terminal domain-containing protein n=1 Tax=Setaria viridis TaxID=4556 RepID=A0A4U6VCQ7_SETVI|nr:proteoglycan 4-like isoform X1 [Setaria viridis]TKW27209.1 hypothetical protein SEVIR_3G243000v2 [Setaria viridis]TKW27211.1 hypothetical protein SEVIR_3G243000v2 [Setaria viridis]